MTTESSSRHARYFAADWLVGLALFVALTVMTTGGQTLAATFALTGADSAVPATGYFHSSGAALLTLGLVFSLLFAFNTAFFRHLCRLYVRPRKAQK